MVNTRWKSYGVVALVFALGGITGAGTTFALVRRSHALLERHRPGQDVEARVRMLSRRLGLSDDQRSRIVAILDQADQERHEKFGPCSDKLAEHRRKIDADIRAVLTPDQSARYQELMDRRRERGLRRGPP